MVLPGHSGDVYEMLRQHADADCVPERVSVAGAYDETERESVDCSKHKPDTHSVEIPNLGRSLRKPSALPRGRPRQRLVLPRHAGRFQLLLR